MGLDIGSLVQGLQHHLIENDPKLKGHDQDKKDIEHASDLLASVHGNFSKLSKDDQAAVKKADQEFNSDTGAHVDHSKPQPNIGLGLAGLMRRA